MNRRRFEGEDCAGEVSGDRYGVLRFLVCDLGVWILFSTIASAKFTVLRGVVRDEAFLPRLMAARVMSCSWRAELPWDIDDDPCVDARGVKNRVKRLGVMGGARLGF